MDLKEKLRRIKEEENEATDTPYWVIIDPRQNFKVNSDGLYNIAGMVTGIWFSRASAERHLQHRRYAFSKNAKVFCMSGYWSSDYKELIKGKTK